MIETFASLIGEENFEGDLCSFNKPLNESHETSSGTTKLILTYKRNNMDRKSLPPSKPQPLHNDHIKLDFWDKSDSIGIVRPSQKIVNHEHISEDRNENNARLQQFHRSRNYFDQNVLRNNNSYINMVSQFDDQNMNSSGTLQSYQSRNFMDQDIMVNGYNFENQGIYSAGPSRAFQNRIFLDQNKFNNSNNSLKTLTNFNSNQISNSDYNAQNDMQSAHPSAFHKFYSKQRYNIQNRNPKICQMNQTIISPHINSNIKMESPQFHSNKIPDYIYNIQNSTPNSNILNEAFLFDTQMESQESTPTNCSSQSDDAYLMDLLNFTQRNFNHNISFNNSNITHYNDNDHNILQNLDHKVNSPSKKLTAFQYKPRKSIANSDPDPPISKQHLKHDQPFYSHSINSKNRFITCKFRRSPTRDILKQGVMNYRLDDHRKDERDSMEEDEDEPFFDDDKLNKNNRNFDFF